MRSRRFPVIALRIGAAMLAVAACQAAPAATLGPTAQAVPTRTPAPTTAPTATAAPVSSPTTPSPTATPTELPGPSERVLELATGGTVFPGTYHTKFEPSLTLTIDDVVDLDCAPGYKCRGDIDVNLPFWVGFEFGNVHGSEFNVSRMDRVYDPTSPSKVIDPPADLAAWLVAFKGLDVLVTPAPTTVGDIAATQLDAQSSADLPIGPTGLTGANDPQWFGFAAGHRNRVILLRVDGHAILITEQIGVENTVGDFDAVVRGLEPLVQSIVWQ